ncbi:MAG: phenylalanine--tRNA ligase subunit beta [Candidatus Peribacteraceae bacterium]|nr:phenylalanine--tRNA ligase subunit beta [Candidatus Peribacteraceae bacterium]
MKISLDWLSDFITLKENDPEAIARTVTAKIAEVDEVEAQGALLNRVVVGKVLSVKKHPNADRLSLCDVKTDEGVKRVVCGGTNLREGMKVAFAHTGATVRWHGTEMVTLEKAKVRGEESEGMICAAEELDLAARFPDATGHSIIDLGDGDVDVGKPLKEVLGLGDVVLHIDNHAITNRPDLFSHRGFARELVAAGLAAWKEKPASPPVDFPSATFPFSIEAETRKLVPRYEACLLEMNGLGETPNWMKRRLEATGWRSINLPIDITNYVLLDVGMPLHSFDAADIKGNVRMRKAKRKEKITTLDGVERELSPGALVMEDDDGIFDLLGIMGGLRGSTKESTRKIWLHSAVVDPANTRKTVVAMGHRTDAATVYEKGVPPMMAKAGLDRAIKLFLELAPGARVASAPVSWGEDGAVKPITLTKKRLDGSLGTAIPAGETERILTDLGCEIEAKKNAWKVTPPLWRLGDLRGDHDLIEEIGRIHGYDAIPPAMPAASMVPPPRDARLHRLRDALKEEGFIETLPLSLVGEALIRKANMDPADAITIQNPLGEELKYLHTSTIPGLLEHAGKNLPLTEQSLATFECARVFNKREGEWLECGLLLAERRETGLKETPFLSLKRSLTDALQSVGWSVSVRPAPETPPFGHPSRSADLFVGETAVGFLTEVHPEVRVRFDLPRRAAAASLDLTTLLNIPSQVTVPAPVPAFPAVTYDVTVTRTQAQAQSTEELLRKLRAASPLLESVDTVDLYGGKPLTDGQYNLTLRFTYRAKDRTLNEEEAKKEQEKVLREVGTSVS